eukprot:g23622.t1
MSDDTVILTNRSAPETDEDVEQRVKRRKTRNDLEIQEGQIEKLVDNDEVLFIKQNGKCITYSREDYERAKKYMNVEMKPKHFNSLFGLEQDKLPELEDDVNY